ncbi:hypothetical protein PFISCL1PPCAC_4127, partial [Pristionchus fissidentatus]
PGEVFQNSIGTPTSYFPSIYVQLYAGLEFSVFEMKSSDGTGRRTLPFLRDENHICARENVQNMIFLVSAFRLLDVFIGRSSGDLYENIGCNSPCLIDRFQYGLLALCD